MPNDAELLELGRLVEVQAGHPFRGSVLSVTDGNAFALQMRDLDPSGEIAWDGLTRTEIDVQKSVQWVAPGDVVFVARGTRNYAVCLREVPKPTVCSPNFFRLRSKSPALLPEFLAWQINRAPAQRYLASTAEGSDQLSIRRSVLEALPLAVPSLLQQQAIVALNDAAAQEERHFQAMVRNRRQQLDSLALALFSNKHPTIESTV